MLLSHQPTGEYVVTLGIDFADTRGPSRIIYELYRGDENDCLALMHRISQPSDDRRSICHWWLTFGPAVEWEAFALSASPLTSP